MTARQGALAASGVLAATALGGCETTADKSARLAERASAVPAERGLKIAKVNRDVRVLDTATVTDPNGTAVVVRLRDTARTAMAEVPIAIDVRDAAGTSLFRNDAPGAEPALVSVALLAPGRDVTWVHDQVQARGGAPARVTVRVGEPRGKAPAKPPRLSISPLRLTGDPSSGTEGLGRVTNHSPVAQRRLTIHVVARRGTKVVAAGRAVVNRVGAGRSAPFAVYFIGDPKGAQITMSAPPTVLGR